MAKLTGNTVVAHPETGAPTSLFKGDDLPAWATDLVGSHLVEGGEDAEATSYADQTATDLKAEVERRNTDRADEDKIVVGGKGNKGDVVAALEADDAKQAESGAGDGGGDGGSGS